MFTWINGPVVVALIVIPFLATWVVGFVNYRIWTKIQRGMAAERGVR